MALTGRVTTVEERRYELTARVEGGGRGKGTHISWDKRGKSVSWFSRRIGTANASWMEPDRPLGGRMERGEASDRTEADVKRRRTREVGKAVKGMVLSDVGREGVRGEESESWSACELLKRWGWWIGRRERCCREEESLGCSRGIYKGIRRRGIDI